MLFRLQWGRTLESAEIRACLRVRSFSGSFNGAALWRVRKCRGQCTRINSYRTASMGPHSGECGNHLSIIPHMRNCIDASMGPHSGECGNHRSLSFSTRAQRASMGPHSGECGNYIYLGDGVPRKRASMGPHSGECGNLARRRMLGAYADLQWGRTLESAEITLSPSMISPATNLQWGRTLESAEISGQTAS